MALSTKQLTTVVEGLRADVKVLQQQPNTPLSAADNDEVNKLRIEFDAKFTKLKADHEQQLAKVESTLNLIINTKCDATLQSIKLFIGHLDEKLIK